MVFIYLEEEVGRDGGWEGGVPWGLMYQIADIVSAFHTCTWTYTCDIPLCQLFTYGHKHATMHWWQIFTYGPESAGLYFIAANKPPVLWFNSVFLNYHQFSIFNFVYFREKLLSQGLVHKTNVVFTRDLSLGINDIQRQLK